MEEARWGSRRQSEQTTQGGDGDDDLELRMDSDGESVGDQENQNETVVSHSPSASPPRRGGKPPVVGSRRSKRLRRGEALIWRREYPVFRGAGVTASSGSATRGGGGGAETLEGDGSGVTVTLALFMSVWGDRTENEKRGGGGGVRLRRFTSFLFPSHRISHRVTQCPIHDPLVPS